MAERWTKVAKRTLAAALGLVLLVPLSRASSPTTAGAPATEPATPPRLEAARTMEGGIDMAVVAPPDRAVLVLGLGIGTETFTPTAASTRLEAGAGEDGALTVDGTLLVEDIGPEARLPSPPRWSFAGDAEVTYAPIVPPGASWRAPSIRRGKGATHVAMRCVVLPPGTSLYEVGEIRRQQLDVGEPDPGRARGWTPVARVRYEARPPAALPEPGETIRGDQMVFWPEKPSGLATAGEPPLPPLYRFGVRTPVLEGLEEQTVRARIQ